MFPRASLRFPCFPFAGLFLAPQRCQGAPLLSAGVFVFPESGAPTGGSSPGQLQMRNSWPAALAAAQIRPFEKITVLPLPPPPVGHARSAEGRGMCRRAGGESESWEERVGSREATFHSTSLRKFFSLLFSPPPPLVLKCFNFCRTEQACCGLFTNKTWQGFSTQPRAVWHSPVHSPTLPGCLLAACFCFLGTSDEWSIDSVKAHCGTAAGYLC